MKLISLFFYNFSLGIYYLAISIASFFNDKANLWLKGRKNWQKNLAEFKPKSAKVYWIHCASLGEFEQGRPLIESIKKKDPSSSVVLTFFSPSGYEIRKNYELADLIMYLPIDTSENAKTFLDLLQPNVAIFIKYEYWYHYISQLHKRKIPTFLVCANFTPSQIFFKWYGQLHRSILRCYTKIFVQTEASQILLKQIGINKGLVVGDTRIDRVLSIRQNPKEIEKVAHFSNGDQRILIAGSSWQAEEKILSNIFSKDIFKNRKLIIAPHDISNDHLENIEGLFKKFKSIRYSNYDISRKQNYDVLIIDNIGLLSSIYQYGDIAIVGGAFGKGLHNILEPATFGLPIFTGPKIDKFPEAVILSKKKGLFVFKNEEEFELKFNHLMKEEEYQNSRMAIQKYLEQNKGATQKVMKEIEKAMDG